MGIKNKIEKLEELGERALYTMEVMFSEGITTKEQINNIKGLEALLEYVSESVSELEDELSHIERKNVNK